MAQRKWLRPLLTAAFYVALVVFLAIYLLNINYSAFANLSFNPWYLLAATVVGLAFRYWQTFIWITVLRGLGARDVHMSPELVNVYAKSWLGRYIPGTAPWILGKIFFASQHGVSKSKLAVGSLLEGGIQIVVLLLTSSIMLLLDPRLDVVGAGVKLAIGAVVLASTILLIPPVFNFFVGLIFRVLRRPALGPENRVGWRTILIAATQYAIGAFISGASLFLIAIAIYPTLGPSDILFVIAAGNLAGAISMLAVFVPGGIGVREGVQLVLLGIVMPQAIALAVVLLTRLWSVLTDLLFFGIAWLSKSPRLRRARA